MFTENFLTVALRVRHLNGANILGRAVHLWMKIPAEVALGLLESFREHSASGGGKHDPF